MLLRIQLKLMINHLYIFMDPRKETIAPVGNAIKTLQKRDRLLNMLLVKKEHQRIAEERFNRFKNTYPQHEVLYKEWCSNNSVPSLMD